MQELEIKQKKLDFSTTESFNLLRSNVEFSAENVKVIAVTSTRPDEGKSTVAFELASSFAASNKRVLIIDGDLRKSVMKNRFKKGTAKYGLTHYLAGKVEAEDCICNINVDNLNMIFPGPVPPNPSELLSGAKLKSLIKKVREHYDIVIIDTPPLGSVVDAALIAKQCDGTIMVIKERSTSYRQARKVLEQLKMADAKVLGCVVNFAKRSKTNYYDKYYGKY